MDEYPNYECIPMVVVAAHVTKLCTTDYSTVCSSGYFSIVLDQAARTGYIVLKFSSIVAKGDG